MTLRTAVAVLCFGLLSLTFSLSADAQTRNRVDHRGKDFRVSFLHTDGESDSLHYFLVVSCEKPTRGKIRYERSGREFNVAINQAYESVRIELDEQDLLLPDPLDDHISLRSLRLTFDDEVTLYGINTQLWSSDAFVALPVELAGRNYTVMSYPNSVMRSPAGRLLDIAEFPSQFCIIGTQNGTKVDIFPTAPLNGRGQNPFTIVLNDGEIFFGQATNGEFDMRPGWDLTGTRIEADKPVVVYGSHQRTNVPWTTSVSRDHLIEQLPPTDKWGYRAILTPHFQLDKTIGRDAAVARVIAARNGTVLSIDSVRTATLGAGQPYEIPLDRARLLTATGPILVSQFHSSTAEQDFVVVPNDTIGDPFMMLVPAQEQFDSSYTFESYSSPEDFIYHYINVVIPTERISSLRLDDAPIAANFIPIDKTSYSYAQIEVRPGAHHITARVPFGLYIYGYGPYNSYGNPGGFVFDSLFKDHKEPDIGWRDTCGGAVGAAFDTSALDFGMESLRLLPGSNNVTLDVDPFDPGEDSINFNLRLIDPYQDGEASLIAVDTAGLERRYRFPVKGFTVSMNDGGELPVVLDTLASLNGFRFCTSITLRNYGKFPQTLESLGMSAEVIGLTTDTEFPITLQPSESRTVEICFERTGDTSGIVDLSIGNGCLSRPFARLPILSGIDRLPPDVSTVSDSCAGNIDFLLSEAYALNSGVAEVKFHQAINARIDVTPENLPSRQVRMQITREDEWQDLIYDVEIVDVVGNRRRITDTIGGLTLAITEANNPDQFGVRFDRPWEYGELTFSSSACDTVWLENYGVRPLNLRRLRLSGNVEFSLPPEQTPIFIQPGERIPVEICVRPSSADDIRDTLIVEFFCNRLFSLLELRSRANPLPGAGSDLCGTRISVNVRGFVKQTFLTPPTPNPASREGVTLTFGLTEPERVTIEIHSANGTVVQRVLQEEIGKGITQVTTQLPDLPSGSYYVRMATGSGENIVQPLIVRE